MRSLIPLIGALLLTLCACASSSGGEGGGSGSSGLGSGGSTSCVFQQQTLTSCVGAGSSQSNWSQTCLNEPCAVASFSPNTLVEDGCSSSTAYQNINAFDGTCDDWTAAGSPFGLSPSGQVCGTPPYPVSSSCQSCMYKQCCSETAACQAGTPCGSYFACMNACAVNDTACENGCASTFAAGYSAATTWVECAYGANPTSCLSDCREVTDAGTLD